MKKFFKYILCFLFMFILNACKAGPLDEELDDPWPEDPVPERESDPDAEERKPVKIFTFEDIKAYHSKAYWDLIEPQKTDLYFQDLEHWNLEELTPDQLFMVFYWITLYHNRSAGAYAEFPEIKPEQLQKLTVEHIKKALCEVIKYLSPEQTKIFDNRQLIAMEFCMDFLTPDHVAVLDMEQLKVVVPRANRAQLVVVPSEYFKTDDHASRRVVTPEQAQVLTKRQIQLKGLPRVLLYNKQMHWLSCEQISWVTEFSFIRINPVNLAGMREEQLRCIPVERTINNLTDEHLRELSFSQMKVFAGNPKVDRIVRWVEKHGPDYFETTKPDDIHKYTYYMQFFKPEYFHDVSLFEAQHFPSLLLSTLTPERIKNFRYYVHVLKPMKIWDFSDINDDLSDVLPLYCEEESCELIALNKRQIEAITLEQMRDFSPDILMELKYKQVQAFSFEQIFQLNKEQLKALISVEGSKGPYALYNVKLHAVMDIAERLGDTRAKSWVETMLKPAINEIRDPVCERYYPVSNLYCESLENKIKTRTEIREFCEEYKAEKEEKLPAYLLKYGYDIDFCLKKIYDLTGDTY